MKSAEPQLAAAQGAASSEAAESELGLRKSRFARAEPWLLLLAGLTLIAVTIPSFGMTQFGGYDHSVLCDSVWRLHIGQRPYTDFVMTLPPFFYLVPYHATRLIGFHWSTFVYLETVFACIVFAWMFWLAAEVLPSRRVAFLLTLLAVACTHVLLSFWWHNTAVVSMSVIFFLSCYRAWGTDKPPKIRYYLSFLVSMAVLLLSKPNVAALAICFGLASVVGLAVIERRYRRIVGVLLLSVGAVLLAMLTLLGNGIDPRDVILSYKAISQRGVAEFLGHESMKPTDMACIALIVMPLAVLVNRGRLNRQNTFAVSLGASLLFIGIYGALTNCEAQSVSWPLLVFGTAIFMYHPSFARLFKPHFLVLYLSILAMIGGYLVGLGYVRDRIEVVGYRAFYEDSLAADPVSGNQVFDGLKTGPRFLVVLRQVKQILEGPHSNKVFFGPRMEFAYSAFNRPSPTDLPVWWHPGSSFGRSDEQRILQVWKDKQFDCLVFLKHDFTRYSPELMEILYANYVLVDSASELTVLYRKDHKQDFGQRRPGASTHETH